ncbi:MAG: sialidase family protein [bacterium]|nr:sialidase family protein [bacterium]
MKLITLLILICIATVCATAQMTMPTYLYPVTNTLGRHFPKITRAPDGTLVLSYATKDHSMALFYVTLSTDGGTTWSAERRFMDSPFGVITLQRQTYAIMDNKGVLHGLGMSNIGGVMNQFYTRSEDRGLTWTPPIKAKSASDMRHQDFGSIAVDSSGTIYISYISNNTNTADQNTHDFVVRSTTNGTTWLPEVRVDNFPVGGSCECCTQNIEVGPNGEVAIAFRSNLNNRRDIHVARSNDGGNTFSTPVNIQSAMWMIGGCPATGPALKYDRTGMLHVSWRDARSQSEPGTCFYAALPAGSTMTPVNINLSKGFSEDAEYPVVAVSEDGQGIAVTWENPMGVYIATSRDGGVTFEKDTLQANMNAYPNVNPVWTESGPFAVWQTSRGTTTDIAFETSAVTSGVDDTNNEFLEAANAGEILERRIYDVMGRLLASSGTNFDIGTLLPNPPALYYIVDLSRSSRVSRGTFR